VVLVSLPTLALAVTVALRGLCRTWTFVWGLGAGTIVFLSGPAVQWSAITLTPPPKSPIVG
jgi:hypothetical protein